MMTMVWCLLALLSLSAVVQSEIYLQHADTVFVPYQYGPVQYRYDTAAVEKGAIDTYYRFMYAVGLNLIHVVSFENVVDMSIVHHEVLPGNVEANDVTTCGRFVAVSASDLGDPTQGKVIVYSSDIKWSSTMSLMYNITVGPRPDMLIFTSDCRKLLVAIEGSLTKDSTGQPFDPEGEIYIIDFGWGPYSRTYPITRADFTSFNSRATYYERQGVRWVYRGENAPFTTTFSQDMEPEYITLNHDETIAYIALQENNAVATLDLATGVITDIYSLGVKSWINSALDPSDKDGGINIQPWGIYGAYQPDAIKYVTYNGRKFLITANEGYVKEYEMGEHGVSWTETKQGEDFQASEIDPSLSSSFKASLRDDRQLGDLEYSKVDFQDCDDKYYAFLSYGGRSFSLFEVKSDGSISMHWDSGSDFEDKISTIYPHVFNTKPDQNEVDTEDMDKRSDKKGPEPESIESGKINGKPVIFIGMERPGFIAVYSVDPITATPKFESLKYSCDNPSRGRTWGAMYNDRTCWDLDPEGLRFIPAGDSGPPFLAVFSTVSSTVSLYTVIDTEAVGTGKVHGEPLFNTFDGLQDQPFHGACHYVATQLCDGVTGFPEFKIITELGYNNFWLRRRGFSIILKVIFEVYGHVLEFAKGGDMVVNGIVIPRESFVRLSLPTPTGTSLVIEKFGYIGSKVSTDFGISFEYNAIYDLLVHANNPLRGKLCGLLGDFDGNLHNDFKLRDGTPTDIISAGNDWKDTSYSLPGCVDAISVPDPCQDQNIAQRARGKCDLILDQAGPFRDCHALVPRTTFLETCIYDMCIDINNEENFCNDLDAYARVCAAEGIFVDWRTTASCFVDCGANAHYEVRTSGCRDTCKDPTASTTCTLPDISSCVCDTGYLYTGAECILQTDCGCTINGFYYPIGGAWYEAVTASLSRSADVTSGVVDSCGLLCTCAGYDHHLCQHSGGCPGVLSSCTVPFTGYSICTCPQGPNRPTDNCDEFYCPVKAVDSCDITDSGEICPSVGNGYNLAKKNVLLAGFANNSNPCWTKIRTKTDTDGSLKSAVVNLGVNPDPNVSNKHERRYTFDCEAGLQKRDIRVTGDILIDLNALPGNSETWTNGELNVEIVQVVDGYRMTASCQGEPLFFFDHGVRQECDIQISVNNVSEWKGVCY